MTDLTPFTKGEITHSVRAITDILSTGIFQPEYGGHPLFKPAFTSLLIELRNLLHHSEKSFKTRISFTDDIRITHLVKDVTDLVGNVRDAVCHPESWRHNFDQAVLKEMGINHMGKIRCTFNTIWGKGRLIVVDGIPLHENRYEDDIYFVFGTYGILLNRHIRRAFNEVCDVINPEL